MKWKNLQTKNTEDVWSFILSSKINIKPKMSLKTPSIVINFEFFTKYKTGGKIFIFVFVLCSYSPSISPEVFSILSLFPKNKERNIMEKKQMDKQINKEKRAFMWEINHKKRRKKS